MPPCEGMDPSSLKPSLGFGRPTGRKDRQGRGASQGEMAHWVGFLGRQRRYIGRLKGNITTGRILESVLMSSEPLTLDYGFEPCCRLVEATSEPPPTSVFAVSSGFFSSYFSANRPWPPSSKAPSR